jgi:DNA-binding response OmpR family regulator
MRTVSSPEQPRLLLIEDDPELGPLIRQVLSEDYAVTLEVDGDSGVTAGLNGDFDVIVIDRRLPLLDGLAVIETLRRKRVTTPILILTALGTVSDKVSGLDAGANDYLVKPFDFDELLARLRALRRTFTGEGGMIRIGSWEFFPENGTIHSPYSGRVRLTTRETALLRLLAENPRQTFTRAQILRVVFSEDDQPGTVDTYVHYIRRKTDIDLLHTVRGQGYRLGSL